jgi:hypothetical protein
MPEKSSSLSPAYAHFETVFERLSKNLRETLKGQLAQLEPLVRFVDESTLSSSGDMSGLGGLTRHGDLSNILQSELLLRTEAPIEFLRRIAETETLYHEKQYQDAGGKRVMRILISAGPGILGYGRIFSLAALFFLARLANSRQEELHWCYLPNAAGPIWFDEISVNTIKRFLKTASFREMTVDDAMAAREIWSRLYAPVKSEARSTTIDWVIGAYPQDSRASKSYAVVQSLRTIGYRLDPSENQKPRGAKLFLKRSGKAHRPVQFIFPEDKVCLSALNIPFAPIKPEASIGQAIVAKPERMENWAPNYISVPGSKTKFVRVPGGVLILFHPTPTGFKGQYFLPIGQVSKIAGLRMRDQQLHMLLQTVSRTQEQLEYSIIDISFGAAKPNVQSIWKRRASAAQLFRNQHRYALPVLAGDQLIASFHATNGKPFSLSLSSELSPHLDASSVIYSNGQHRVVQVEAGNEKILRTIRANHSTGHEYALGNIAFNETPLLDMLYVSTHGQLAFSIMPNTWTLPGKCNLTHKGELRHISPTLQCEFANYERPLSLRCAEGDIYATIWSDASCGGDGSICNLKIRHDRILSRRKLFDVRQDIGNVFEIIQADDGVWIVTGDERGVPKTLHHYSLTKRIGKRIIQHEFDDLRDRAQTILLESSNHG